MVMPGYSKKGSSPLLHFFLIATATRKELGPESTQTASFPFDLLLTVHASILESVGKPSAGSWLAVPSAGFARAVCLVRTAGM